MSDTEGVALKLQDFLRLMRTRWITVCASVLVAVVVAIAVTLMTTPQYQASTRLFVSASAGNSASDVYQAIVFRKSVLSLTRSYSWVRRSRSALSTNLAWT